MDDASALENNLCHTPKKCKKKKKQKKHSEGDVIEEKDNLKKKKTKRSSTEYSNDELHKSISKKAQDDDSAEQDSNSPEYFSNDEPPPSKKLKRKEDYKQDYLNSLDNSLITHNDGDESSLSRKSKKKKSIEDRDVEELENDVVTQNNDDELPSPKKVKKKSKKGESGEPDNITAIHENPDDTPLTNTTSVTSKKRKKKLNKISNDEEKSSILSSDSNHDDPKQNPAVSSTSPIPWLKTYNNNDSYSDYYEYIACGQTGRQHTISMAIPASILEETVLRHDLQTYVIGQIARAACIYGVDEIIVYDDHCWRTQGESGKYIEMMKMLLEYQECPQYLRKDFFSFHEHLRSVGVLNTLNAPHHLRFHQWCTYREGVVRDKTSGNCSFVHVGLKSNVEIDRNLKPGLRVTVKFPPEGKDINKPYGKVVSPEEPRTSGGLYWGYTVRVANSLSKVLKSERFKDGYDLIIGTSDKGDDASKVNFPSYKHALIVFGAVEGLEAVFEADKSIKADPRKTFQYYVNTCPRQQSRTIRTEEAVLITLSILSSKLQDGGIM